MTKAIISIFLLLCCLFGYGQKNPQYEFRAVWIATVENIDWPSRKGLPVAQQKEEFIHLLNLHKRNGMNAVVMQVRPVSDAFYPSRYEPWSEYLTGKQGRAPFPYYDPLQFMIEETHKRGMEFHAWLNPFRAIFNINKSDVTPSHISKVFPNLALTYGSFKWYDPGMPQVQELINKVVKDLVERYDVDGVHFDDYFYPYPISGKDFPDDASYAKYGNGLERGEWRRNNVDTIIKQLGETIKSTNPRVKFGISPFGVWRNKNQDPRGSESKAGITNYDNLYADILLWLEKGWIDYVAPQLYWETSHSYVGFNMLMDWWSQHSFGRHLYIGQGIYRSLESRSGAWKTTSEIPKQIRAVRANDEVMGSIFFSSKTFDSNPMGWNDSLRNNYYKYPAIVPPMAWIDSIPPMQPLVESVAKDEVRLYYRGAEPIKGFAIFAVAADENEESAHLIKVLVADKTEEFKPSTVAQNTTDKIFVACIDRNNNVSTWVQINTSEVAKINNDKKSSSGNKQ